MEKTISLEEKRKEVEDQIKEIDENIESEMSILQQQESYIRHQTVESINGYVGELAASAAIEAVISVLIKANLTTSEEIKKLSSEYILENVKTMADRHSEFAKEIQTDIDKCNELTDEKEIAKQKAIISMKELTSKIYKEETEKVISKMTEMYNSLG